MQLRIFLVVVLFTVGACSPGGPRTKQVPALNTNASSETKTLEGIVVSVIDGDTIEILDDTQRSHRIRLKGIDSPERNQAFGNRARENLALLVAGKRVKIDWEKLDRRRIVGKVFVNGLDVCLEQIRSGYAWHFKRFANEQRATDQIAYANAEVTARSNRVGLWVEGLPTPPWDYREQFSSQ